MRKMTLLPVLVAAAFCFAVGVNADDAPKLKCPVSNKPASTDHALAYKDGKVYFCCDNCPKAFAKDKKKYVLKANAQLVASGQYKEVKCPLTGKPLNTETAVKVGGVEVCFCCNNCKGRVEAAKGAKKAALVFNDAAFAKGFEKVKDAK